MMFNQKNNFIWRLERGQSTVAVILSLAILLLLIIGVAMICMALFTVSTMEDYDNGEGLFEDSDTHFNGGFNQDVIKLNSQGLEDPLSQDSPFAFEHALGHC